MNFFVLKTHRKNEELVKNSTQCKYHKQLLINILLYENCSSRYKRQSD